MPYVIRKRGGKHCVVSTTSGKTHGCHDSRAKAIRQQRALYANAPESAMAASGPDTAGVGMVALYPRPEEAKAIAVEGGLAVDDLHVTLVFLGDVGTFDEAAVTAAVGDVAASHEALVGEIGGEGHFSINADGIPVILLPDVPDLGSVRENIVNELLDAGFESPSEHGFLPHITQMYVESLDEVTPNVDTFHQKLHFDAVSVVVGDRRLDYPFGDEDMSSVLKSSCGNSTIRSHMSKDAEVKFRATPGEIEEWRAVASEEGVSLSEWLRDRASASPTNRDALRAHAAVSRALDDGILERQPCEECGAAAEAHHDDYSEPLQVRWLCRKHHKSWHAQNPSGVPWEMWNLRLTPEMKSLWSEAAEKEGLSVSEFVRTAMERGIAARSPESEEEMAASEKSIESALAVLAEAGFNVGTITDGDEIVGLSFRELAAAGLNEEEISAGAEGVVELTVAVADADVEEEVEVREPWEGVLGTIGSPTSDSRYLVPDEIDNRDLPLPFSVQPALAEGHDGAINAGRIDRIEYVAWSDFDRREEFYSEEQIDAMSELAVVIWGEGSVDGSPAGLEAKRQIENGADVSLDGLRFNGLLYDAETFSQVTEDDVAELEMGDVFQKIMEGAYLQGVSGKIGGATVVSIGAFEEARVIVTASASLQIVHGYDAAGQFAVLVAAAGPVKPPIEWFEDPQLSELTPLTIDKDGRVSGHLADWDGCHMGFQGVCVPPFESHSNYAYFNVGQIETAEGSLVPCGKLMFCMDGNGHAPTDPSLSYRDVQRYYDDSTKVGAFVRAGSDRFGTWLAGALRPGLTDIEVQHLRMHGPSGDWRPIKTGDTELIAAFAVPVQGFPIARPQSLVASAGGEITAIITAPLSLEKKYEELARLRAQQENDKLPTDRHALLRRQAMLLAEFQEIDFPEVEVEKAEQPAEEVPAESPFDDGYTEEFAISAADRRRMAKSGAAMPDGSFPIMKCSGDGPSAENARRAIGRAPAGKRAAVKAHIAKREKTLGCASSDEDTSG